MSHRANLYMVRVRRPNQTVEHKLLGNLDGEGTTLRAVLAQIMDGFTEAAANGLKLVSSESTTELGNDELFVSLRHGESGVAADILRGTALRYHQEMIDTHVVRCGCLFRLPRNSQNGWAALHINNNRGVTGLLQGGISERFTARFPDLRIFITPFVLTSVLDEAISQGRVEAIRLIRYEQPGDRAFDATSQWVRGDDYGRIELAVTTGRGGGRLKTELLRRFRGGTTTVLNDIVTFDGLSFDEAMVEVELPNGLRRSFNLERPDTGFPYARDIDGDLELDEEENPTEESLILALQGALDEQIGDAR